MATDNPRLPLESARAPLAAPVVGSEDETNTKGAVQMLLRQALDRLFDRMNYLNGLLYHLDLQLGTFRDIARERISNGAVRPAFFASSGLVVRDLTEWPSNGWAVYHATGGFGTSDEEFLAVVDRLVSREAAWTTAQGFEAFESCVKDLLAAYYHAHPAAADATALRKDERSLRRKGLDPSALDFWNTFVRRQYRSANDVLSVLRGSAPQILDAEHKNNYGRDLTKWLAVVSRVRHAVTHSNLTISKADWNALTEDERRLTEELFSGLQQNGAYEVRPTVKQANEALTRLVEYGFAVFKALCVAGGHEWRILR